MHVCMLAYMCVRLCECMHACTHELVCVYMYVLWAFGYMIICMWVFVAVEFHVNREAMHEIERVVDVAGWPLIYLYACICHCICRSSGEHNGVWSSHVSPCTG